METRKGREIKRQVRSSAVSQRDQAEQPFQVAVFFLQKQKKNI